MEILDKKKILILGRPAVGKTTIKQVVFEGIDPNFLLEKPLQATRSMTSSMHSWLDLELGVFDSAGQKLDQLLKNKNQRIKAFQKASFIIYLFDYSTWLKDQDGILSDLNTISEILENESYSAELVLFCHKYDLMLQDFDEEEVEKKKNDILSQLKFRCFFTSIQPSLIYSLYNAFHELLSSFSEVSINLKSILDAKLRKISKTMFFITNMSDNIVAQSITKNFNIRFINYTHNIISLLNQTLEDMNENDKINHLILQTANNISVILYNLNQSKNGLKNIICLSETLTSNKLIWNAGELSREINKKIRFNR